MIVNQNTDKSVKLTDTQRRRLRRKQVQERQNNKKSLNETTSAEDTARLEEPINSTKPKSDNLKMSENITQDKSRDEVKAQREAKKLAKQNAKLKTQPDTSQKTTPKEELTKSKGSDRNVKGQESTDEVDRASVVSKSPASAVVKPKTPVNEIEKSRDAVKAEREAKKLAKQAAKNKSVNKEEGKDIIPERIKENVTVIHKNVDEIKEIVNIFKETKIAPKEVAPQKDVPAETKSKAELRAERRAKQEAQRAAKESSKTVEGKKQTESSKTVANVKTKTSEDTVKETKQVSLKIVDKVKQKPAVHKVKLFQHLYTERLSTQSVKVPFNSKELHPAILRLGVKMATRVIRGPNAQCIALLDTLKQVIRDYLLPAKTDFARGLESHLAACLAYLSSMRAPTAAMTNAVKHLRRQLTQLPNNVNEFDAKSRLNDAIDTYICHQIEMAGEAISIAVRNKISNGDNILTYGCSSLIAKILKEAWSSGLKFRTVVVGSRSNRDGLEMLRRLTAHGLPCTYINISAINYLMKSVTKVILGASCLLGNGWVLGIAGTAQIALAAAARNVPVLVCCETHKFSERVLTDAFVYNEIGDPDALIDQSNEKSPLKDWRSYSCLTPLNLEYDVTPPKLVTAVVTELAVLPCTSAPVVLRYKLSEYGM